jgi:hypothetical protein
MLYSETEIIIIKKYITHPRRQKPESRRQNEETEFFDSCQ